MKIYAIAKVTFLQIIRQPIYGVLLLISLGLMTIAPSITGFTMDDDTKMLQDLCLSTILLTGLLMSAFGASGAISSEIEDQTILTIVSKPINRLTFIAGKFIGVLGSLLLANIFMLLVFLLVLRHGVLSAAYMERDIPVIVFGLSAAILTLIIAGLLNYLFDWQFAPTAMGIGLPLMIFAVVIAGFFDKQWQIQPFGKGYSVDVIKACILLTLAVWILAGICLVCSTRLNVVWTLVICFIILCFGMIWDYYVLPHVNNATNILSKVSWSALYAGIPNFQSFWMLDALDMEKPIPWRYVLYASEYAICYISATMLLAYTLFLERQVGTANRI